MSSVPSIASEVYIDGTPVEDMISVKSSVASKAGVIAPISSKATSMKTSESQRVYIEMLESLLAEERHRRLAAEARLKD
jgi:hypothetical protein